MKVNILKSILLMALLMPFVIFAQKINKKEYKAPACLQYTWDTIPAVIDPDTNTNETGAIILSKKIILDFAYDEKGDLYTYETDHFRIKVTEDKALEEYNKIYIPMGDVKDLITIKARFINKDMKITEVEKSQIKLVENLENKGNYKIFAIEGGEKGGLVEYFYVLKKEVTPFGYEIMQSQVPIKKALFRLTCPEGLGFLVKSYNGFKNIKETEPEDDNIRIYEATMENIPGLEKEIKSAYRANEMRVEYTVAYNYNRSRSRIYSFNEVSKNIYGNIMENDKDEKKAAKKLLKEINIGKSSQLDNIRKIESYVKTKFNVIETKGPKKIDEIIEKRYADDRGFVNLFAELFSQSEIKFELVLTCNRFNKKFDPQFDSWNFIAEYLFFFPEINKYMSPTDMSSRVGFIPYEYESNSGLFLRLLKVGDVESFIPSVKQIPAIDYTANTDSLVIKGSLNEEFNAFKYNIHHFFSGLNASGLQPYIKQMDDKARKKMVDQIFETETNNKLESFTFHNIEEDELYVKPFIIDATITAPLLVETAGNNILLKIGETIGVQEEMYKEKERKMPIEESFAKQYFRYIEVTIPDGYKLTNAEDLNMKVILTEDGKETAGFITTYEIKGNKLIISNHEFYKNIYYPKEKYLDFRNVINASADFNKKTLIFTKK